LQNDCKKPRQNRGKMQAKPRQRQIL